MCMAMPVSTPLHASSAQPSARAAAFSELSLAKFSPQTVRIEDAFQGTSLYTAVLIQDAHSAFQAQKNIKDALLYLQDQLGVSHVFLEGASGIADLRFLKTYPDTEVYDRLAGQLAENHEISGGLWAALKSPKAVTYEGLEDWEYYQQGLRYYLRAREPYLIEAMNAELSKMQASMENRIQTEFPEALKKLDQALDAFESQPENLLHILSQLILIQPDLDAYPDLKSLVREMKESPAALDTQLKGFSRQVEGRLKKARGSSSRIREFSQARQAYETGHLSASDFADVLTRVSQAERMKIPVPQAVQQAAERGKQLRQMTGGSVMDQFRAYAEDAASVLISRTENPENLGALYREKKHLRLLRKLSRLELARAEWTELKDFLPEASLSIHFDTARSFYQNAEAREKAFAASVQRQIQISNTAVVLGGFHTDGMKSLLRNAGISFVLLTPFFNPDPDEPSYDNKMRGDVSWKRHFESQSGKVNLHRAFLSGVQERLLDETRETKGIPSRMTLKLWRDELMRSLGEAEQMNAWRKYRIYFDRAIREDSFKEAPAAELIKNAEEFLRMIDLQPSAGPQFLAAQHINAAVTAASGFPGAELAEDLIPAADKAEHRAELRMDEAPLEDAAAKVIPAEVQGRGITKSKPGVVRGQLTYVGRVAVKEMLFGYNANDASDDQRAKIEVWQTLTQAAMERFEEDEADRQMANLGKSDPDMRAAQVTKALTVKARIETLKKELFPDLFAELQNVAAPEDGRVSKSPFKHLEERMFQIVESIPKSDPEWKDKRKAVWKYYAVMLRNISFSESLTDKKTDRRKAAAKQIKEAQEMFGAFSAPLREELAALESSPSNKALQMYQGMKRHYESELERVKKTDAGNEQEIHAIEAALERLNGAAKQLEDLQSDESNRNNLLFALVMIVDKIEENYFKDSKARKKTLDRMISLNKPLWALVFEDFIESLEIPRNDAKVNKFDKIVETNDEAMQIIEEFILSLRRRYDKTTPLHSVDYGDSSHSQDDGMVIYINKPVNVITFMNLLREFGPSITGIFAPKSKGSLSSHWVLMAQRSAHPPSILIVEDGDFEERMKQGKPGDHVEIAIDENQQTGQVHVNPSSSVRIGNREKESRDRMWENSLHRHRNQDVPKGSGYLANVALGDSTASRKAMGAEGTGLIRTEVGTSEDDDSHDLGELVLQMAQAAADNDPQALQHAQLDLYQFFKMKLSKELSDPFNSGKKVVARTVDFQFDKNEPLLKGLQRLQAGAHTRPVIVDDQQPITGFDFYRNVAIGRAVLQTELAALFVVQAEILRSEAHKPSLAHAMFPMVKTKNDMDFLAAELESAKTLAHSYAGLMPSSVASAGRRTEQDLLNEAIHGHIQFGIMIETLDAVDHFSEIAASYPKPADGQAQFYFSFYSVGTNDLEEDIITDILRRQGVEDPHITRDHPLAPLFFGVLRPEIIKAVQSLAAAIKAHNEANPNDRRSLSLCGDLAGDPKFQPLIEWLRRQNIPVTVSTSVSRLPQLKFLARKLAVVSDEDLNRLFARPGHHSDSGAQKIVDDILARFKPVDSVMESWNQRYQREGRNLAFQQQHINVIDGMGSAEEFVFLKNLLFVIAGREKMMALGYEEKGLVSAREALLLLQHLRQPQDFFGKEEAPLIFDAEVEELREGFIFLSQVRDVYRDLGLPENEPLLPGRMDSLLDALEIRGIMPSIPFDSAEARENTFRGLYEMHALNVFNCITRVAHELYKKIEEPRYDGIEKLDHGFVLRRRNGKRFSREEGYVDSLIYEVAREGASDFFEKSPERLLTPFLLAAQKTATLSSVRGGAMPIHLSHEVQKAVRQHRDKVFSADKMVDPAVRASLEKDFDTYLTIGGDISYANARLNRLGLFDLLFRDFSSNDHHFLANQRFSIGMQAAYARTVLETLSRHHEAPFQTASQVLDSMRERGEVGRDTHSNPKTLKGLRLAAMLSGVMRTKIQGESYHRIIPMVRNILKIEVDPEVVEEAAWLLFHHHYLAYKDFVSDAEIEKAVDWLLAPKSETTPDRLNLLYVFVFATRWAQFDPDSRAFLLREGMLSPLSNLETMYMAASSLLAQRDELRMAKDDLHRAVSVARNRIQARQLQNVLARKEKIWRHLEGEGWKTRLETYLEEHDYSNIVKSVGRKKIYEYVSNLFNGHAAAGRTNYGDLLEEYAFLFSPAYVENLDEDTIANQMVVFALMKVLARNQIDSPYPLFMVFPLPHHYRNSYEIIFLAPKKERIMPALITGTLFALGYDNAVTDYRHTDIYLKRFIGFLPEHLSQPEDVRFRIGSRLKTVYRPGNEDLTILKKIFTRDQRHVIGKPLNPGKDRPVVVNKIEGTESLSSVTIETPDRPGILYAILSLIYWMGHETESLRFDDTKEDYPRISISFRKDGKGLSAEKSSKMEYKLRQMLQMEEIDMDKIPDLARSELRLAPQAEVSISWSQIVKHLSEGDVDGARKLAGPVNGDAAPAMENELWNRVRGAARLQAPGLTSQWKAETLIFLARVKRLAAQGRVTPEAVKGLLNSGSRSELRSLEPDQQGIARKIGEAYHESRIAAALDLLNGSKNDMGGGRELLEQIRAERGINYETDRELTIEVLETASQWNKTPVHLRPRAELRGKQTYTQIAQALLLKAEGAVHSGDLVSGASLEIFARDTTQSFEQAQSQLRQETGRLLSGAAQVIQLETQIAVTGGRQFAAGLSENGGRLADNADFWNGFSSLLSRGSLSELFRSGKLPAALETLLKSFPAVSVRSFSESKPVVLAQEQKRVPVVRSAEGGNFNPLYYVLDILDAERAEGQAEASEWLGELTGQLIEALAEVLERGGTADEVHAELLRKIPGPVTAFLTARSVNRLGVSFLEARLYFDQRVHELVMASA